MSNLRIPIAAFVILAGIGLRFACKTDWKAKWERAFPPTAEPRTPAEIECLAYGTRDAVRGLLAGDADVARLIAESSQTYLLAYDQWRSSNQLILVDLYPGKDRYGGVDREGYAHESPRPNDDGYVARSVPIQVSELRIDRGDSQIVVIERGLGRSARRRWWTTRAHVEQAAAIASPAAAAEFWKSVRAE